MSFYFCKRGTRRFQVASMSLVLFLPTGLPWALPHTQTPVWPLILGRLSQSRSPDFSSHGDEESWGRRAERVLLPLITAGRGLYTRKKL